MASSSSIMKRLITSSPWTVVSIALAVGNPVLNLLGASPTQMAFFSFLILFFGGLYATQTMRRRIYADVIDGLRKGLTTFQSIFSQDAETSPMRLMTFMMSTPVEQSQQTQQAAWVTLNDATAVIHQILVQEIQDSIRNLNSIDPSIPANRVVIKVIAEDSWRTLTWYHVNVIGALRRVYEEKAVSNASLRKMLSKFQLVYNEALKGMRTALEKANSELNLGLDTNIDKLLLSEFG